MDTGELLKKLERPNGMVDVVLDTDAYNEIDDQFAIAYMLKNPEKLNVKALYAAPFFNKKSSGPKDGMERSYGEILKVLSIMERGDMSDRVFKGSEGYLETEGAPVISPAAEHLAALAAGYSPEKPLYVIAIGAITNVASAILINPEIINRMVVVWLGGHGRHWPDTREFNLFQDVAAARVVFGCGIPVVQLPCSGVVSAFTVSEPELRHWLIGKNAICDYLAQNTIDEASSYAAGKPWTRVIWDVSAVAWLLDGRFFAERLETSPIVSHDGYYSFGGDRHFIKYVYHVRRDELAGDLFKKLAE